jgi:hypothetical protein
VSQDELVYVPLLPDRQGTKAELRHAEVPEAVAEAERLYECNKQACTLVR